MKHNISFNVSKNALRTPINIYGSGLSGLVTAYNFLKLGFIDVRIHTKGRGIIQSEITPHGVVEYAANSILQNESVTKLLRDIHMEYEYYSSLGKKKFIFHNGKALKWPFSFFETLRSLYALVGLGFKRKKFKPKNEETIDEWGKRTVGDLISQRLIQRGLQGIYGPDTKNLSAKLCLAPIFKKNKKASKGSISFKNGMGSFIKVLENEVSLMGAKFQTLKDKEKLSLQKPEGVSIICTPSHSLPEFIDQDFSKISYHPISIVTLIFKKEDRLPFEGFGCLFKSSKSNGVLGVILNSDLFDNRARDGEVSETWILDGRFFKSENQLEDLLEFRKNEFGLMSKPLSKYFKYWDKAFPVYNLDLERTLENIKETDNVYFFGNWTGKIGIGRLIEESPEFIKRILNDLSKKSQKL